MTILARAFLVVVLACSAVVALAAPRSVPRLDYTPPAGVEIKTIAIIAPPDPPYLEVKRFDEMRNVSLGLVGMALTNNEQDEMKKAVAALLETGEKFRAGLAQRIAERLTEAGYVTMIEAGDWQAADGSLSLALDKVQSTADAVVLVTPTTTGFINPGGAFSSFIPTALARIEMVGPDRSRVIYRGFHAAGWIPAVPGLISIKPIKGWTGTPARITYADVGEILKDIPAAVKLLYSAEDAIARGVEADLRR